MSEIELIKIENFGKFETYSKELLDFIEINKIKCIGINSMSGQVLALLTCEVNRNKHIDGFGLQEFIDKIGLKSRDVIQAANKTDQWGLVGKTIDRKYYTIPFPFKFTDTSIKKRKIDLGKLDRNESINFVKKYLTENYIEIPNEKWEVGHLNPNKPDGSIDNLVFQPPIQGKFRDRFIFDKMGLLKYPTPQELDKNFHKYYTDDEMLKIYELLKKRLNL